MSDSFITSHIRRIPLFGAFNSEQLDTLATAFQVFRVAPNQVLYYQGERTQALYYFASGSGQLWRVLANRTQQPVGMIEPGEYVGEHTLFSGVERDVTAVATQESVILLLTKANLDRVLAARADIRALLNLRPDQRQVIETQRDQNLRGDETILLTTRRHPWVFLRGMIRTLFVATVLFVIGLLIRNFPAGEGLAWVLFGLSVVVPFVVSGVIFLEWRNDYFTVTNQRVIHESRELVIGALKREQILLEGVQNVALTRLGYLADIVGLGDVELGSPGRAHPFRLDRIPNPAGVQKLIFDQTQLRVNGGQPSSTVSRPQSGNLGGLFPRSVWVDGTRIVYHKHWLVLTRYVGRPFFGFIVLALILLAVGILRPRLGETAAIFSGLNVFIFATIWVLVNGWSLLWGYLSWLGDVYVIEDEVLVDIHRAPFGWREHRSQASLWQVQNVTSSIRGLPGRIFNYGDVHIQTAAGSGKLDFNDVPNPTGVADEILKRIHALEQRNPRRLPTR
jgi:hypothetical protein